MDNRPIQFGRIRKGIFIERPNRFLIRCRVDRLGVVEAFLPNPGRLWELLLPNVMLYLTPCAGASAERKTQYTILAVERDGEPVFLHTHLTNQVARCLIEDKRIPGLEDAEVIRAEAPVGHSRFDFLLRQGGEEVYMEVKSCTLFGNDVAMFPDAITERGKRHLLELAELGREGPRPIVLFLVHTPNVRWFMPDYHTDLAFSKALLKVRDDVRLLPVSIGWTKDLSLKPDVKLLDIPWGYLEREVKDQGSYLLLIERRESQRLPIGSLGVFDLPKGYYLYVGSAMRSLSARVDRHLRKRKKVHWHVDYLLWEACNILQIPIRSSQRQECEIARAVSTLFQTGPPGFGSSDCSCPTHLFYCPADPLNSPAFLALLQRFRMGQPR